MTGWGGRAAAALVALLVVVAAGALAVLRPWANDESDAAPVRVSRTPPGAVTIFAVGDIARCGEEGDEATAALIDQVPDATVLALGDMAYDSGTVEDFKECYDPSWGPFRERTRPVPGNHEYETDDADPYFDYFGALAGEPGKGWYSFDLGDWHFVALNSNCDDVDCDHGSEQVRWLRDDLAANDARCTIAFWHAPRFTSGEMHGSSRSVAQLWQALLDGGVEVLLSGHEHLYERTAPLDARGAVEPGRGVRQFVVGTGGGRLYELGERIRGSESAIAGTYGVLQLTLRASGYDWQFVPVTAGAPSDQGSDSCR